MQRNALDRLFRNAIDHQQAMRVEAAVLRHDDAFVLAGRQV